MLKVASLCFFVTFSADIDIFYAAVN